MAWVKTAPGTALDKNSLEPGDILIHHGHHQGDWGGRAFHCSIVGPPDQGVSMSYDSLPHEGVRRKAAFLVLDKCAVFRPIIFDEATQGIGLAAAAAAERMYASHTGYSSHFFGVGRAIGSVFGRHNFGKGAQKRLDKYSGRQSKSPKNVFCSEYVILCYQLGCLDLNLGHDAGHFPNRDAKYTTPWDLEAYLLKHATCWQLVGGI